MKDILARAKLFKNDENRIAPLYLPSEFWSKQSPEDFLKALMILAEQELICTSVAFPGKLSEWQAKWNQMLKYPVWGELLEVPKKDYTGKELVQMLISVDLLPKEATEESLKYQRLGEGANGTVMKYVSVHAIHPFHLLRCHQELIEFVCLCAGSPPRRATLPSRSSF
jgi:hypothetical protein